MSPYRGLGRTLFAVAAMLILLLAVFGCSDNDLSNPEETVGAIEIKMPAGAEGATWHLYGPGNSFQHGDAGVVLNEMPTGQYTIIWTAVKDWTAPAPALRNLTAGSTLVLAGEYQDKAPGSNFAQLATGGFVMGSQAATTVITPGDPPDTTKVPAEMGRDADEVQHNVGLGNNFFLQKTEVSNQEFVELGNWALSMGYATATESSLRDALDGSTVELINFDFTDTPIDIQDGTLRLKNAADANGPLIEVTWFGAASYCDWLSLQEGLTRAYDHDDWAANAWDVYDAEGYRLPTEAEWEYACRAGTQTAFSSGDIESGDCTETSINSIAWYCGTSPSGPQDVGTKAANQWGLFDMTGNVWEWCNDWYGPYDVPEPSTPDEVIWVVNPVGPQEGANRIIRGGRWLLASTLCRSASRMMADPYYRGINIGFRPAITAAPGL